mmetsp:Transcript_4455/g.8198  ORF Transcript_4455/g.8198 Transcript_4455/m.8198 type:complete len:398 (-) Transcript_4455:2365-3558(-)
MADNQVENESVQTKEPKRRLSASEYQKYIVMEQGIEVDSRGEAHLAEREDNDVLFRIPSWMVISESRTTVDKNLGEACVHIDKPPQHVYIIHEPTKWQRCKAEICDVLHELLEYGKNKSWKKKILTVIVFCSSILVFYDLLFVGNISKWIESFILWMGDHIVEGIVAFIGIFIITTLVFVPPTLLTFGCGYVCSRICGLIPGIIIATMACFIGSVLGALIAFFRSRYMMRDLVRLFAKRYSIVRAVDKAIKRHGFRVLLLLRLCPLIPFHALNYIGGITAVRWEAFTASMIGMLPIQILTVTIGATTGSLVDASGTEDQQLIHTVLVCSGLAFTIIAFCIILYMAKKELTAELEEAALMESSSSLRSQQQQEEEDDNLTHLGIEHDVNDEAWFWLWV